ncbi:hypothetical protein BGZ46_004955, partial [Entomortierella lignicola]
MRFKYWSDQKWGTEYERSAKNTVRDTWYEHYMKDLNGADTQPLPDPSDDDNELSLLGLATYPNQDELEDFVMGPAVRDTPLSYWKKNPSSYQQLAGMARDFFTVPATSASSERCFSKARSLLPYSRNRLGVNKIKEQMLLRS